MKGIIARAINGSKLADQVLTALILLIVVRRARDIALSVEMLVLLLN